MGAQNQRHRVQSPRPAPFAGSYGILVRLAGRLLAAMRIEEKEVARQGGAHVLVQIAEAVEAHGDACTYRLTLSRGPSHLHAGSDVSILVGGGATVPGRVLRTSGRHIWVVTRPLGPRLHDLVLRSDVDWLWSAAQARIRQLWPAGWRVGGSVRPNDQLIVDMLRGRTGVRPGQSIQRIMPGLNSEQQAAVRSIMANTVTFLFGPPGTGKTETVAVAVSMAVQEGRSVLVATPSNAAADLAAARIAERLRHHPEFDLGLVVRYGSGSAGDPLKLWADRLVPIRIALRLARETAKLCHPDSRVHSDKASRLKSALSQIRASAAKPDLVLSETGRRVIRALRLYGRGSGGREPAPLSPDQLVSRARVVVCTAHQLIFDSPASRSYDTVVIDEASQMSLPLVLIAAAHARGGLVIAGDPRQLRPTVLSSDRSVRRLVGRDIFDLSGITTSRQRPVRMLVEQHRMAPTICDVVSEIWYGGLLRTHASVLSRPVHPLSRNLGELLYMDTSACRPTTYRTSRGSRVTPEHVALVKKMVLHLRQSGLLPPSASVVVATPYTAQAARLAAAVPHIPVSTVHSYQGGEADVVILDLTDAPGLPVGRFLRANGIADDGGRLLAVAASRARYALIVVADFHHLERQGGRVVRGFLRRVRVSGVPLLIPGRELPPDSAYSRGPDSSRIEDVG